MLNKYFFVIVKNSPIINTVLQLSLFYIVIIYSNTSMTFPNSFTPLLAKTFFNPLPIHVYIFLSLKRRTPEQRTNYSVRRCLLSRDFTVHQRSALTIKKINSIDRKSVNFVLGQYRNGLEFDKKTVKESDCPYTVPKVIS